MWPTARLSAAALGAGLCACTSVDAFVVRATALDDDTVQVEAWMERPSRDCLVLYQDAKARVDGEEAELKSLGRARAPRAISGREVRRGGCAPAYARSELAFAQRGEVAEIRVDDRAHHLEMRVRDLRARAVLRVSPAELAPGQEGTVEVAPEGLSPLERQETLALTIWREGERMAVLRPPDVRVERGVVVFRLPRLPPGPARVSLYYAGDRLEVVRCRGAARCEAFRVGEPAEATFEIVGRKSLDGT